MKTIKSNHMVLGGQTKICVPVTGKNKEEIREQLKKIKDCKPDVVEWRADFLKELIKDIEAIQEVLQIFKEELPKIPIIFTIRTANEGGEWSVEDDVYKEICLKVAALAKENYVDFIDVEVQRLKEAEQFLHELHQYDVCVIGSNHHFFETPSEEQMLEILKNMEQKGADVCKIAVMPKTNQDVSHLIEISAQASKELNCPIITMSMAEKGSVTRVCTRQTGSVLTFAAAVEASAPGQLDVETVRTLLKINESCKVHGNISLIGFMGTGKTTISKALSRITGLEEIDVDQYIVEKEGKSINQIFEEVGESGFRKIETEAIRTICSKQGQIISCGGGAVLKDENVELLKSSGIIVLLKATPETVFERVKHDQNRPLLKGNMNIEYIEQLMQGREERYNTVKDLEISVDCNDRVRICAALLQKLQEKKILSIEC